MTVHVPNQPSTNGQLTGSKLFSKKEFDMMKDDAIYISTCRGPVTDEAALIEALEVRRLNPHANAGSGRPPPSPSAFLGSLS